MSGSIETAIKITGMSRETFYRWRRRVRDGRANPAQTSFIHAVEAACSNPKLRCEELLTKHGKKDWRAIAWWLARKYPNEYGRRRGTSTDEDGNVVGSATKRDRSDRPSYHGRVVRVGVAKFMLLTTIPKTYGRVAS